MLGARAVEGATVELLRLLLLLLLPALPGLGVVGSVGAGLPESVIWAVNAGGEAHVDVHGIHFRKDPLEGRVGRGESPSRSRGILGLPCRAQPAEGCGPRAPSSTLGPRLWREVSPQFPRGSGHSSEPDTDWKLPRAIEAESWREVIFRPRTLRFLNPSPPPRLEKCKDGGGLLPPRGLTVVDCRCPWPNSVPGRFLPTPTSAAFLTPAGLGLVSWPE